MNNKFFTKRKIASVIAVAITIFLTSLIIAPFLPVNAVYAGQSSNLTREQLHSATLEDSGSNNTPAITILTHGLGGSAKDWSSDFNGTKGSRTKFEYDSASIIERMRRSTYNGINLYRAQIKSATSFTLDQYNVNTTTSPIVYSVKSNAQIDFSKHIVIVMEDLGTKDYTMQQLYDRLHYVLDTVSYEYYMDKNCLPRINLIGHSMGGLLNMQYVIEHPKNVASLISLGTPYNGSWYDNWFVNIIIDDFEDQPCITGTCGHSYYFCNLETRKKTWNKVYDQNPHINFHALSGETSLSMMEHIVWTNDYIESYVNVGAALGIRTAFAAALPLNLIAGLLPGDVCVDTDSQKAVGYNGAVNYNKKFTPFNCNVNKRSQDTFPVPHNLEIYDEDMQKYILRVMDYGSNLSYNSYTQNGITASIIDKSSGKWMILLTNNTGSAHSFEYNQKMCFDGEAQSWDGLGDIESTLNLANGASTTLEIEENAAATSITISYTSGSIRYIFFANKLDETSGTMSSYRSTKTYNTYTQNSMTVSIVSKYFGMWTLQLTNSTSSTRTFDYNTNMCFEGDAQNWNGLNNVATTVNLAPGMSTIIKIHENGAATCIAISFRNGSTRQIHYAYDLDVSGTMSSKKSNRTYFTYTQHGMKVGIVGINDNKWTIELTNKTGSARCFEYNKMMCFEGDAQNWNGLSNVITTANLSNGASTTIEIEEYIAATSIAISYTNGSTRYIFYAKNLNISGTMSSNNSHTPVYSYTKNGMKVGIVGKNGTIWQIKLINDTGSSRSFDYNSKMCFDGDAQNWKGLSNVSTTISLTNGSSTQLYIQENGFATAIAISYMDGVYRKVFYANGLDPSGKMSPYENIIDTSAPPDECLAAGSMITLADGSQKAVEDLTGDEMLLVWNMQTGTFDSAPILFIDSDPIGHYEVIELAFSDNTTVDVIYEHGFWDVDLNEYIYLNKNAAQYIGHRFNKQTVGVDGSLGRTEVTLTDVEISTEVTTAYSPVTYGHLCYYVNGMLSMPGGITGLMNIFDVDAETLTIDQSAFAADIAEYGLFTYEEFYEIIPVPEEIFDAFNGQYLKVSVGKGLITYEQIGSLIERYFEFF